MLYFLHRALCPGIRPPTMSSQPIDTFSLTSPVFAYVLADPKPASAAARHETNAPLRLADVLQPPTVFGSDGASHTLTLDTGWDALLAMDLGRPAVTLPVQDWPTL
jgi:hypothetical protein